MDKVGMVKKEVQLQNWSEAELARQESGLTVTQWCRQERISTSTYYYRLRKRSEKACVSRYLYRLMRSRRKQKQTMRRSELYPEI